MSKRKGADVYNFDAKRRKTNVKNSSITKRRAQQFHRIDREFERRDGIFGVAELTKEREGKRTADAESVNLINSKVRDNTFKGYRSGGLNTLEKKYHDTFLTANAKGSWVEMVPNFTSGTSPSMLNILQGSSADQRDGNHITVTKVSLRLKGTIKARTIAGLTKEDLQGNVDVTEHKALRVIMLVDRQPTTNTNVNWDTLFDNPLAVNVGGRRFLRFYNNSLMSRYIVLNDVLIPFKREAITSVSETVLDDVDHRISVNSECFEYIHHQNVNFDVTFDNVQDSWSGISENDIKLICVLDDVENAAAFQDECLVECNCRVRYLDP